MPSPLTRPRCARSAHDLFDVATRDTARYALQLANNRDPVSPDGELIHHARRLRALSLRVLSSAVLMERAAGATWAQIADALRIPEVDAREQYEDLERELSRHGYLPPAPGDAQRPAADAAGGLPRAAGSRF